MRILLAHNSVYYPGLGGGDKSNRLLMEALAARGHEVRVVARVAGYGEAAHRRFLAELAARSVAVTAQEGGVVVFRLNGVEVHTVTSHPNLRAYFSAQLTAFDPQVVIASTDDPAQVLLEAALRRQSARVVYLVRATLALPFGPDCAFPSEAKTAVLRRVDKVVGVSRYVADYVRRWSGIEAVHVPISLLEPGPYPELGRFDNEFVTLVNPCAVKGITIFLELARRLPEVRFAAVPTWGTNAEDRAALAALPNVELLEPVDHIDELLRRTRVLLVPSLWAEARSRIVVEAMLRGVPVMASSVGGIPEAKMGVPYLLPVRPIERYRPRLDEQMVPVAEVPDQDVGPWEAALRRLLSDRQHWEEIAQASRAAALAYAEQLSVRPFEELLEDVVRSAPPAPPPARAEQSTTTPRSPLEALSAEKRALLALRLRQKREGQRNSAWFPRAEWREDAKLRLFCLPHAGGGTALYWSWEPHLSRSVLLCPVRLPGRETRWKERAYERMEELVTALGEAIQPYLQQPFAFFGHSMGAGVAFELARWLRRGGRPLPCALLVSGARAPQLRNAPLPPLAPDDGELLAQLQRLGGAPPEWFEKEELKRLLLPALRADVNLYRSYVCRPEPPLPIPIRAYGGTEDPNLSPSDLEAWKDQTTAGFSSALFPGGHFFLFSTPSGFLEQLSRDLAELVELASARER
ncbi:MAG: alpha/beta fold hydrolase [Bryobacterales bacterium]|nr:alpha/beta fold hydrolase [Bryobacteraceae bacterium]MDW8355958.1 alpha/beta fold hydrolase [Bryobacterales bacterium]